MHVMMGMPPPAPTWLWGFNWGIVQEILLRVFVSGGFICSGSARGIKRAVASQPVHTDWKTQCLQHQHQQMEM